MGVGVANPCVCVCVCVCVCGVMFVRSFLALRHLVTQERELPALLFALLSYVCELSVIIRTFVFLSK